MNVDVILKQELEVATTEEMDIEFTKLKRKKAPGLDGITYEILIRAWDIIKDKYKNIFNKTENFQIDVKTRISKAQGGFRPLTLLPVLGKLEECVLLGRL